MNWFKQSDGQFLFLPDCVASVLWCTKNSVIITVYNNHNVKCSASTVHQLPFCFFLNEKTLSPRPPEPASAVGGGYWSGWEEADSLPQGRGRRQGLEQTWCSKQKTKQIKSIHLHQRKGCKKRYLINEELEMWSENKTSKWKKKKTRASR